MANVCRLTGAPRRCPSVPRRDAEHPATVPSAIGQQRVVEAVQVGELLLLGDVVHADADPLHPGGRNSAARSRKWQASLVQPVVIAAG